MLIKNKYLNRHSILKTLYCKRLEEESPNTIHVIELSLSFNQLATSSKLSEAKIIEQLEYLLKEQEINKIEDSYTDYYFITINGVISYHDKKYLGSGKKEFWNTWYDVIKTISALSLLIIAIIAFVINIIVVKNNKKDIDIIKAEIQQIKDSSQMIK